MIRHIVWDWNGTLFDDQEIVTGAANASLRAVGGTRQITVQEYRDGYRRPLQDFYQDLLDSPLTAEHWPLLEAAFRGYYTQNVHRAALKHDALSALDGWAPRTQSLLSMFEHDNLMAITEAFGLHPRFSRIDGRPADVDFGSKQRYLTAHVGALRAQHPHLEPGQIGLIGDTVDDAIAAFHIGAAAVLCTGGSSSRSVLEGAGVPVVDSLGEAVALLAAL